MGSPRRRKNRPRTRGRGGNKKQAFPQTGVILVKTPSGTKEVTYTAVAGDGIGKIDGEEIRELERCYLCEKKIAGKDNVSSSYCHGCKKYICDDHAGNASVGRGHNLEDHDRYDDWGVE